VQIDVYYANCRNILMDLWIIIKTVGVVVFPKDNGAY
jgi:lipopolysaccharide/colanic/teichoic acid biosynthesis glycosyltransferase